MKKLTYLAAIAMIAFTSNAVAQDSDTSTSTATVVAPIDIIKKINMNFGNLAASTTAGTVVLAPAGTRTKSGGVTLPATAGTVAAASFDITGEGSYTYDITLPTTALTVTNTTGTGAETMTVDTFTSNPSGTGQLTTGAQTLKVGATLNVKASQVPGVYDSGTSTFTVTVNYN